MNAIKIGKLFYSIQRNVLGRGLILGFAQVAKSKEVRDYMMRGKKIADKNIEVFSSIMSESDIAVPMIWDGASGKRNSYNSSEISSRRGIFRTNINTFTLSHQMITLLQMQFVGSWTSNSSLNVNSNTHQVALCDVIIGV